MAKSTGKIGGNAVLVYQEGELITCTTGATLSVNNETVETTCKDNNGARTYEPGSQEWTIEVEGITKFDVVTNFSAIAALAKSAETVLLKYGTENPDDPYWEGEGFVSAFSYEGPLNAPSTWSATFSARGPINLFNT